MTPSSGRCKPAHTLLSNSGEIHSFLGFARQAANSHTGWSGDGTAEGSESGDGCDLGVGTGKCGEGQRGTEVKKNLLEEFTK